MFLTHERRMCEKKDDWQSKDVWFFWDRRTRSTSSAIITCDDWRAILIWWRINSMKIVYVNDYTLSTSIVYALIIWRWMSRRTVDFVRVIDSLVSRMFWDLIDSFIKTDRNLFSTLQRFRSTYLFNSDVNDSRQIIWCCRNYSIDDLIRRFRWLSARNIVLRRSFWKNLKCISIICDESINARTTIDYETCSTSSINSWCDRIHCIIDDTWDCDSINAENWSVIHITKNMSWRETASFFVTSIRIFHNWSRSNATSTWFKTSYLWMTKISTIVSSFFLTCIIICRSDESEWSVAIWRRITIFIRLSIRCTSRMMSRTSISRERTSSADVKMFAFHYSRCLMKVLSSRNSFDECYYRDL
jgi:hypothetical protein